MNRYPLYDLENDIPEQYKYIFESLNKTIRAAFANPGQLKRNAPGIYYIVLNNELITLEHQNFDGYNRWIARECSLMPKWYTDGHETLKELKKELGI